MLALPLAGKKKPKEPPAPTQPDIVRGCLAVRGIVFQRARLLLLNSNVGVSGFITNDCGRDAYVSIYVEFFDASGDRIDMEDVEKLVSPGGAEFRTGPDPRSSEAVRANVGRITDVYVRLQ
jgi:hypothetical protein